MREDDDKWIISIVTTFDISIPLDAPWYLQILSKVPSTSHPNGFIYLSFID